MRGRHVIVHYGAQRDKAEAIAEGIRATGAAADVVRADFADHEAPFRLAPEVTPPCGGALP